MKDIAFADLPGIDTDSSSAEFTDLSSEETDAAISEGIITFATDELLITFINPSAERIFGYSESEMLGQPITFLLGQAYDVLYESASSDIDAVMPALLAGASQEMVGQRADDSIFPMEVMMAKVERGKESFYIGTFRDITEWKRVEQALRESEERTRLIIKNAHDAVITMDAGGVITGWNDQAETTFGWSRQEVVGRLLSTTIIPCQYQEAHETGLAHFLSTGEGPMLNRRIETTALHRDGHEFPVELTISPMRSGGMFIFSAFVRDITERRRAEAELQKAIDAAEAANRSKGEFLATMSHEIRTPMNGIIGMSGLLLDANLTSEQQEYAETIRSSADALLTLINDILDFSKIEAGKIELDIIDFDLHAAIDEALDLIAPQSDKKGLELAYMIHHSVPALLRGAPERLRQIILNLLSNAVKFTAKGEVVLRVTLDDETETQVTVRFEVSDTGVGIPNGGVDRLFKSFSQVDASTTRKFGGTGLGLAIAKQLCELMGGEIGVESEDGKGSVFWCTAVLEKQPGAPHAVLVPPDEIQDRHVLIVDDNTTSRQILIDQLAVHGGICDEAADGAEALEKLRAAAAADDPFDLALLGFQMPDMDGEALAQEIKASDLLRELPLILLTSIGQRGDADRIKDAGFSGYLTKPIKPSRLFDCITTVLSGNQQKEEIGKVPLAVPGTLTESQRMHVDILLVEDNPVNQRVAARILQKAGYQSCDVASDGLEAMDALSNFSYDLILMDCQMPEMDGFEATAAIRSREKKRGTHVPIIAMTANAMLGDRERCLNAGMDDYISKPVKPDDLVAIVEKWVSRKSDSGDAERQDAIASQPSLNSSAVDLTDVLGIAGDDQEFLAELAEEFLAIVPDLIASLKTTIEQADSKTAQRAAHSIKGCAATFGAESFRQIAFRIEQLTLQEELTMASELLAELDQEWVRVKQDLRRMLPVS
ncbi:MAG: response regulator [Candidatus Poribacteria bacterium]|nr:response regulator [Candidatus Poribacteria bacterium]